MKIKMKALMIGISSVISLSVLATDKIPDGWNQVGTNLAAYKFGIDKDIAYSGEQSAYLESAASEDILKLGSIGAVQTIDVGIYKGKTIKVTAYSKSQELRGDHWFEIQTSSDEGNSQIDAVTSDRNLIKGSVDWTQSVIEINVSESTKIITYGAFLKGKGKVWIDDFTIEIVQSELNALIMSPDVSIKGERDE